MKLAVVCFLEHPDANHTDDGKTLFAADYDLELLPVGWVSVRHIKSGRTMLVPPSICRRAEPLPQAAQKPQAQQQGRR